MITSAIGIIIATVLTAIGMASVLDEMHKEARNDQSLKGE